MKHCLEWSKARRWLQHHGVKYDNFPEEQEFASLIFKHGYEQKAKDLVILKASQEVTKKLKDFKMAQKAKKKLKQ